MKILKTAIAYFVVSTVIYLILLIVVGVVLYQNKPTIEKQAAVILNADRVKISDFFNLPFIMVEARNVVVRNNDGVSVNIDRLRFYYNILKMPFSGPAGSVSGISADRAEIVSARLGDLTPLNSFLKSTNTNLNVFLSLNIGIRAKELIVLNGNRGGIHAGAEFRDIRVRLKKGKIGLKTELRAFAGISNQVEFLDSTLRADLGLDLSNFTGAGTLIVSNLNLGGVSIMKKEKIPFAVSNAFLPDLNRSVLSNYFTVSENGGMRFRFEKDFRLDFDRYGEYSILEYVLDPGDYRLKMSADFRKKVGSAAITVTPVSNQKKRPVSVRLEGDSGGFRIGAAIHTPKYGDADADIVFRRGDRFPAVRARLDNFFIMDGLRIGGDLRIVSSGKTSRVTADSIRINGGFLGSAYTVLNFREDGVYLTSPLGGFNENIEGWFKKDGFEMNVRANNLSGSAAVSNIILDFMGISHCTVNGDLKVVNDGSDQFVLTANATGYRKVPGSGVQKYVTTDLKFVSRDLVLTFPHIEFPTSKLLFNAGFQFRIFDRATGTIDVSGGLNLYRQFDLPLAGRIDYDMLKSGASADFSLDQAVRIRVNAVRRTLSIDVTSDSYPLRKAGYDGTLDLDFHTLVENDNIQNIRIGVQYALWGGNYSLSFKANREKDRLKVRQFLLDNRSDKLVASGFLWQSDGRLFGQIDFIRGGKISFSSTFDDIIGSLEMHNWYFKDFLKEGQDVFATVKADFNGPLILPDINGNVRVMNSVNSEKFIVELPSIQKKGEEIVLKNVSYRDNQSQAGLNAKWNPAGNGFVFSGDGDFALMNTVRGKYTFSYFSQTNQKSVSYDISALNLGGRDLKGFSGGFIWKGNRYTFFKKGEYGLSGYFLSRKDYREWNLDATDQDLQGNFSGEVKNGRIKSDLIVQAQLYYLGFFDLLKDMTGEGKVSLKLQGPASEPVATGSVRLYRANIGFNGADTKIRDLNLNLGVENSRVIFNNSPVTTSSGNFLVKGYVDMKNFFIPYFEIGLLPYDKKLPVFTLNYSSPALKLSGDVTISNLLVSGTPSALYLAGNVTADNAMVVLSGLNSPSEGNPLPPLVENIRWNLPIRIGSAVKFANEFIDVILKKDDMLVLMGDFANSTFTLKGKAGVNRGTLTYLGRDFTIKEGTAYFYGISGDPYPYVNLSSTFRYRDEKNEYVDVYLTFEGKLSTIVVRDFYSIPSKSKSELSAVLGLKSENIASGTNALLSSGVNVAGNIWLFNPLGSDLRRRLGLDLFTIRTGFFENWARRAVAGDTNVDMANMWEGTSLMVGKYLFPNVFIQYEMTITRNPFSTMELIPIHSIGVDFDLRYFDLGWKYEPVSDLSSGVIYENKFELNFNRQF